jgi:signal peptidase I
MIPEKLPKSQDFVSLIPEEKSFLEVSANRLFKKHLKKLPDFTFDNKTVTSFGNFVFLDKFKEFIGFKNDIIKNIRLKRGDNIVYSDYDILDHMINSNLVGKHHFAHYNDLIDDPGFLRIKDTEVLPDESTCRKSLDKIEIENIAQLKQVTKSLLNKKAKLDGPREVWISIDDSVSVLYGNQEKGSSGYNPKRKGANSYKIKVSFIQDTDELINISLHPGSVHSNDQFADFLKETINNLPQNTVLKGVLADRGFFSEKNCELFEKKGLLYLLKAKMYRSLKKQALSIPEDQWQYVGNNYWVAEKSKDRLYMFAFRQCYSCL